MRRRGIRKRWLLVQSRTDLVAAHPELLEAWRPIAQDFDIFFGLEAATNEGLTELVKDTTVDRTVDAVGIAREFGYGVTGNFVIDPDWDESDFERLWRFVKRKAAYGRYHPTFADFRGAVQDVLDRVPTTHAGQLASLMTLNFQEFDDVSVLAA